MADIEKLKELNQSERSMYPGWLVEMRDKVDELVEAYNQHVHYAREMQYPTSTPDNPKVYSD